MRNILVLIAVVMLLVVGTALGTQVEAQGADCAAFARGDMPSLASLAINFSCEAEETVYFGACDSGPVPNDDVFSISFESSVVARNAFSGSAEYVDVGSAVTSAGSNTATLVNHQDLAPIATFSYAISPDRAAVENYMRSECGADFAAFGIPSGCARNVPIFTTDTAPTAGTLRVDVQYGEQNREEGWTVRVWDVDAGERINNRYVSVPAPKYVRVWWQADGSNQWSLLPSQYWMGDGTTRSEYGVSCDSMAVPSYHTSFEDAIPAANVPAVPALR